MKRKEFLQGLGLAGMSTLLPNTPLSSKNLKVRGALPPNCTLIPSETLGPFPLDLTENATFFRQDVRETKTGVRLDLKIKIIGQNNCQPMQNVRVNIWHCDKDGLYSGYSQNNNPGQAGLTYLRGYQLTDANGEANFVTIFPGWYTGRICHIHFQAFVSSVYAAVSQLTFPITTKNSIYAANPALYTKGADPMSLASDNIFSDGYAFQLATLTPNATTGGYDSYLEVTINGTGISGLAEAEPETGGQFKLGQNFPNPYSGDTTIPFSLANTSDVLIELFDLSGKKVGAVSEKNMTAGEQKMTLNMKSLSLSSSNYVYQLQVQNSNGVFRQCKMMTAK